MDKSGECWCKRRRRVDDKKHEQRYTILVEREKMRNDFITGRHSLRRSNMKNDLTTARYNLRRPRTKSSPVQPDHAFLPKKLKFTDMPRLAGVANMYLQRLQFPGRQEKCSVSSVYGDGAHLLAVSLKGRRFQIAGRHFLRKPFAETAEQVWEWKIASVV